jgi:hypothetical protein
MESDRAQSISRVLPSELRREENVGQLGITVGAQSSVPAMPTDDFFEGSPSEPRATMPVRTNVDYSASCAQQRRQQDVSQEKMGKVIDHESALETILRLFESRTVDAGIVDQQVDFRTTGCELGAESVHLFQTCQVRNREAQVSRWDSLRDSLESGFAPRPCPTDEHDLRA